MHNFAVAACSADGYIADSGGDQSRVSSGADLTHLRAMIAQADGVIIGRRTYEIHVESSPALQHAKCLVVTSRVSDLTAIESPPIGEGNPSAGHWWYNPNSQGLTEVAKTLNLESICWLGGPQLYRSAIGRVNEWYITKFENVTFPDGVPLIAGLNGDEIWSAFDSHQFGYQLAESRHLTLDGETQFGEELRVYRQLEHSDIALLDRAFLL